MVTHFVKDLFGLAGDLAQLPAFFAYLAGT
jgi:hypothetical protein